MAAAQPAESAPHRSLVERLRAVHLEMVDAVLGGDGLGRVAQLAADAAGRAEGGGGPPGGTVVAIVVPRLGAAAVSAGGPGDLGPLRRYVGDRAKHRPWEPQAVTSRQARPMPPGVLAEVPITSGDDVLGCVLLLGDPAAALAPEATEFLHLAAVASLTEVAVEEAKEEVEQNLRGSFLEELRAKPDELDPHDVVRRAARLGCDLARGAVVLCAELSTDRPRHVVATIAGEHPGALAQHMELPGDAPRVYALLPAAGGDEAPEATLAGARRLAARLQRHGTVGLSSFYADPAELGRAIQEAELVLDVLRRSDVPIAEDIGTGTYRLLFRVLASHPEEVRSFYDDTVAPIVKYDDQYATDLVGTLEAYLEQNCNMNATAAAIYAHRHTVAYRLDRVKELTALDPMQSEDRERLGLGLKAYRIIAPRLPR
jgi:sugar diacid utilization regulator